MKGAQSTGTLNHQTAKLYSDRYGVFYMVRGVRRYLTNSEWHDRVTSDLAYLGRKTRVRVRAGREEW